MYQVCTNHVSITHQYVPKSSTIHLMYVPTHQLLVSTMYSTCTSTKIPHQFHHPSLICNYVIDLVYMITYLRKHHQKNLSSLEFQPYFLNLPSEIRLRYPLVTSLTYISSIFSSFPHQKFSRISHKNLSINTPKVILTRSSSSILQKIFSQKSLH